MVNMGLKLDYIIEAREKLEGIGLLRTFVKKDNVNKYIYELYSPISGYDFFMNPVLIYIIILVRMSMKRLCLILKILGL